MGKTLMCKIVLVASVLLEIEQSSQNYEGDKTLAPLPGIEPGSPA